MTYATEKLDSTFADNDAIRAGGNTGCTFEPLENNINFSTISTG